MPHTRGAIDVEDETITELEMIVGFDHDLAGEATRISNRLHGLLTQIHPSLESVYPLPRPTPSRRPLAVIRDSTFYVPQPVCD